MKLSRLRQILLEIEEDATGQADPEILFWIRKSSFGAMSPDDHDIDYSVNVDTPRGHREPHGEYSLPLVIVHRHEGS